jgi:hypothetical protein
MLARLLIIMRIFLLHTFVSPWPLGQFDQITKYCTSTCSIFFYGSTASVLAHIITASTCINYLLLGPPDVRNDVLSLGISPTFCLRAFLHPCSSLHVQTKWAEIILFRNTVQT